MEDGDSDQGASDKEWERGIASGGSGSGRLRSKHKVKKMNPSVFQHGKVLTVS